MPACESRLMGSFFTAIYAMYGCNNDVIIFVYLSGSARSNAYDRMCGWSDRRHMEEGRGPARKEEKRRGEGSLDVQGT